MVADVPAVGMGLVDGVGLADGGVLAIGVGLVDGVAAVGGSLATGAGSVGSAPWGAAADAGPPQAGSATNMERMPGASFMEAAYAPSS